MRVVAQYGERLGHDALHPARHLRCARKAPGHLHRICAQAPGNRSGREGIAHVEFTDQRQSDRHRAAAEDEIEMAAARFQAQVGRPYRRGGMETKGDPAQSSGRLWTPGR